MAPLRSSRLAGQFALSFAAKPLRARQKIRCAFWRERRAGRCKAPRRRRCGDIVEERQRRRCPPAAAPRRAAALMPGKLLKFASYVSIGHEAAAKCQIILARTLTGGPAAPRCDI